MELDKANLCTLEHQENHEDLRIKIAQFIYAIEQYKNNRWYSRFELFVSVFIVLFQMTGLYHLFQVYSGSSVGLIFSAFILAFIITDFINGIIHMYMDNNTHYTSIVGPFIAAFHLHHSKPRYAFRHPLKIYFFESGTKFWLLGYLSILMYLQHYVHLPYGLDCCLVFTGVLSSLAEVSHYWCHNSPKDHKIINLLQNYHLLLSKKHHAYHHRFDNTHYAFLNGMTDPLINRIARHYFMGYKNHADQHTAAYIKSLNE